jgi:hypothetical protein
MRSLRPRSTSKAEVVATGRASCGTGLASARDWHSGRRPSNLTFICKNGADELAVLIIAIRPQTARVRQRRLGVLRPASRVSGNGVRPYRCWPAVRFFRAGGLMIGVSVWESTLQRHIPPESLSRVSSYDWFCSFAFYPLGLALWGSVAASIGIAASLWVAFALFVAAILAVLAVPEVRRLSPSPAPSPSSGPRRRSARGDMVSRPADRPAELGGREA